MLVTIRNSYFLNTLKISYSSRRALKRILYSLTGSRRWTIDRAQTGYFIELAETLARIKVKSSTEVVLWGVTLANHRQSLIYLVLGAALMMRGIRVRIVICDKVLDGCNKVTSGKTPNPDKWKEKCRTCYPPVNNLFQLAGFEIILLSELVDTQKATKLRKYVSTISLQDVKNLEYEGISLGRLVYASVSKYFNKVDFESEPNKDEIVRRYLYSGLLLLNATDEYINQYKPDRLIVTQGDYITWGIAVEKAINRRVEVLRFQSVTFFELHEDLYFFEYAKLDHEGKLKFDWSMPGELWEERKLKPLAENQERRLSAQMARRSRCNIYKESERRPKEIHTVGFFCQCEIDINEGFLRKAGFRGTIPWLLESIEAMVENSEIRWLIRVHPDEYSQYGDQLTMAAVKKAFPKLPDNIEMVSPVEPFSDFILRIDAGVLFAGTAGLELPLMGKVAVIASTPHYSRHGFTVDAKNKEDYFVLLRTMSTLTPLRDEQIELARKYAYAYFVQRAIPFHVMDKSTQYNGGIRLKPNFIESMMPGNDPVLDYLCDGVTSNSQPGFWLHDKLISETSLR